jgi:hypothetical protein
MDRRRSTPGRRGGRHRLTQGCTNAFVLFVSLLLVWLFLMPTCFPPRPRHAAKRAACQSNLKQLAQALRRYAADNGGRLPAATHWREALREYATNPYVFACPERPDRTAFAFNSALGGRRLKDIRDPDATPLLFETSLWQRNAHDHLESFILPHPKGGWSKARYGNVAFLSGRVRSVTTTPAAVSQQGR